MTILVVNDYDGLYTPFWAQLGGDITNDTEILLHAPKEVRLICFTGGADVGPELYGHRNLGSFTNPNRDALEQAVFAQAVQEGIPMTGICRGAQFLNVMCGGTLVQDLPGHQTCKHEVQTLVSPLEKLDNPYGPGEEHLCSGDHHQMIVPGNHGRILAWAKDPMDIDACVFGGELRDTRVLLTQDGTERLLVTEAVAYPHPRVFAVQHHPEWLDFDEPCGRWTLGMTKRLCLGEGS